MKNAMLAVLILFCLVTAGFAADPSTLKAEAGTGQVRVELYGTSWCGYCKMAKKFFNDKKIPFIEYDIENDRDAYVRFRQYNPQGGVPFVVIGKYGIPGYSEQGYRQALEMTLTPATGEPVKPPEESGTPSQPAQKSGKELKTPVSR